MERSTVSFSDELAHAAADIVAELGTDGVVVRRVVAGTTVPATGRPGSDLASPDVTIRGVIDAPEHGYAAPRGTAGRATETVTVDVLAADLSAALAAASLPDLVPGHAPPAGHAGARWYVRLPGLDAAAYGGTPADGGTPEFELKAVAPGGMGGALVSLTCARARQAASAGSAPA
jgi:hypothetical protein